MSGSCRTSMSSEKTLSEDSYLTHPPPARRLVVPLFLFFFASGFSALLYQTVWLKYLNLLFGSTTYATAAVLSAFMFGLTLGAWLAARTRFLLRSSLRSYGILETGVGLFALIFPLLYSRFHYLSAFVFHVVGPQSFAYNLLTFLAALVVLLVPTSLMGATLPTLSHYIIDREHVSKGTGVLYAINTVGAVAGILVSAFVLIPSFGLTATLYFGSIINLVVGVICFAAGSSAAEAAAPVPEPGPRAAGQKGSALVYLYAISGLVAIGYEVVWTRILVLHLGSSVYAYAIMLSVFLIGISAGSYASGKWMDRFGANRATVLFCCLQIAWAFAILLQVYQFVHFSDLLYTLAKAVGTIGPLQHFVVLFTASLLILLLPTFLSGALFPAVVSAGWSRGQTVEEAVSRSYSFNTLGGIFGSLVAAFLLIPLLGTQGSLLALAACNLLLGLAAGATGRQRRLIALDAMLLVIFVAASFSITRNVNLLESAGVFQMTGKEKLVHLEEDSSAAVSVEKRLNFGRTYDSLSINGVNVAGTSPDLIAVQKLQGHIPMTLFGAGKPKSVLHIGFGSGGTAYAVSLYPQTKITVVELSRSVVRNADAYFRSVNHGIVQSGKLRFIYFDGRSFLQNSSEKFDVILSDSIHPRYSGNGSLYTLDYYRLVYDRLNDGGVHSQWIPIYSLTTKNLKEILRAFTDVFPETYVWYINSTVNPYIVVTGKKKGTPPGISLHAIRDTFAMGPVRQDLLGINVVDPYFLLDYFLAGPAQLKKFLEDTGPHSDDRMTVEYESSRILNREASWLANFARLLPLRTSVTPYLSGDLLPDASLYGRFYKATTENLNGQLLFLLFRFPQAKEHFKKALDINPVDTDPYEFHNKLF